MAVPTEPLRTTSTPIVPYVQIVTLLTSGVLAGAFAYGRFIVFPTFFDVPTDIQLRFRVPLMARNATLVPPLIAAVLLSCVALAVLVHNRDRLLVGLASASTLACLLITFFGSVPISKEIKTWNPDAPPPDSADLLHQWNIYNDVRSIAAIAPFLLVLAVLLPKIARLNATQED
ncbi:MAG: hypothetical protein QOE89_4013 [Pseudonocardiales bacterium]|nr:hypothetical protein [Pseudonocardiales bacterium]